MNLESLRPNPRVLMTSNLWFRFAAKPEACALAFEALIDDVSSRAATTIGPTRRACDAVACVFFFADRSVP